MVISDRHFRWHVSLTRPRNLPILHGELQFDDQFDSSDSVDAHSSMTVFT